MTDIEKVKALFAELGLEPDEEETHRSPHPGVSEEHQPPEGGTRITLCPYRHYPPYGTQPKVRGYDMFAEFLFDAEGRFVQVVVAE